MMSKIKNIVFLIITIIFVFTSARGTGLILNEKQRVSNLKSEVGKLSQRENINAIVSSGEKDCFQTINEAIQSAPTDAQKPYIIFIKNGVYNERVIIDRPFICLVGESRMGTIIQYAILSTGGNNEVFNGKELRGATVMIQEGADNCTITRLTVYNNYGSTATVPTREHQFAVFGRATRTTIVNCNLWSDGNDDLALWGDGMYYHADCDFSCPGVDFLCPRGWCYTTRCRFYGDGPAEIWHDGRKDEDMKLVICDSYFDAEKSCVLGRYHHDSQIYLLNCHLSDQIADVKIGYAYENRGEVLNEKWGGRIYMYNVTRDGQSFDWMKNNLNEAKGSPDPNQITAKWTFGNQWDPEKEFSKLGALVEYEKQNVFDPIHKPAVHHSFINQKDQIKGQNNKTVSISMEPFGDSMRHWYGIHDSGNIVNPKANQARYPETEITKIADNILLYQRNNGGWPKNYDMQAVLTPEQCDSLLQTKNQQHTTFDNSTTYTHIEYLAKVFSITQIEKYKDACLKGIEFTLSAQYPNGGWPQYFPLEKDNYSRRITFNDGAYIGIMKMLRRIVMDDPDFTFIGNSLRERVQLAYKKGVDCILKMQIVDNGRLTVWCQQHDENSLQPAWARAFEPPAICNGESAAVVLFLMDIDNPDPIIIESVQRAVKWFHDSEIYNTKVITVVAPPEKSRWRTTNYDKIVVVDSLAPPIWTRYYEPGTDKPLFCDRRSKYLYSLAEVSRERRSGYGWYTYAPQEVLDKYPDWQKKWAPDKNVLAQ